jgi:hypothetical protein
MSWAKLSNKLSRRATMASSQPSLASICAMQRPRPTLAPVTNAVLPLSCKSMVVLPEMPNGALKQRPVCQTFDMHQCGHQPRQADHSNHFACTSLAIAHRLGHVCQPLKQAQVCSLDKSGLHTNNHLILFIFIDSGAIDAIQ